MNMSEKIELPENKNVQGRPCCSTLSGRRGSRSKMLAAFFFGIAAVAVTAGIATKWGWLVAVGAAPVIMALLPCILMCALGVGAIIGLARQDAKLAKTPPEPDNLTPLPFEHQVVKRFL